MGMSPLLAASYEFQLSSNVSLPLFTPRSWVVDLMCPPPFSYEKALSPNVGALGGNRVRLGYEAEALLMELVAFKTE